MSSGFRSHGCQPDCWVFGEVKSSVESISPIFLTGVSQVPSGLRSQHSSGNRDWSTVGFLPFGFQKYTAIFALISAASGCVALSLRMLIPSGKARIHCIVSTRPSVVLNV